MTDDEYREHVRAFVRMCLWTPFALRGRYTTAPLSAQEIRVRAARSWGFNPAEGAA